jgi:hypothetical protein
VLKKLKKFRCQKVKVKIMPVAYIYIYMYMGGSYFLIKEKINKSKKNCIKIAMPVAKRRAECASKCCLEGILSA